MFVSHSLSCEWDAEDWRQLAACRDSAPDLFFPAGKATSTLDRMDGAKEVCRQCLVRADCLDFALMTNQEAGIWGGTTEGERRSLRRKWLRERRQARARAEVSS